MTSDAQPAPDAQPTSDPPSLMRDLALTGAFLTRLPFAVRAHDPAQPPAGLALAGAMRVFPIIGLLVGFLGWLVLALATRLHLPPLVGGLLAVATTILLTGGLHEDGLADTADGFGAFGEPARKLAIMRDSRSGAYAILALILSVGLRAAALAGLLVADHPIGRSAGALLAAHAVGRAGIPAVMALLPPARQDGLGAMAGRPEAGAITWSLGLAALIALVSLGLTRGLLALLAVAVTLFLLSRIARRQIGGYTGDVLGAAEQLGEIVVLLVAVAGA